MKTKFTTIKQEAYYQAIADHLENKSEEIFEINECTENRHNRESNAYFNYDKKTKEYSLCDICQGDYCQRVYESYVSLPFFGNAHDLMAELESNLIEDGW